MSEQATAHAQAEYPGSTTRGRACPKTASVGRHDGRSRSAAIRAYAKRTAEALAVRTGALRLARILPPHRALILAYHNVVPRGEFVDGEASLHLPQESFAEQLDLLADSHEVVPLTRLLEAGASPNARRPLAAITFDDAYRGAVTAGVEELARRGLPATIFVAPAFVGGRSYWWDALAEGGQVGEDVRRRAIDELGGRDAAVRRWALRTGLPSCPASGYGVAASEDELAAAVRHPGVTLASHTWSHANLTRLASEEVDDELVHSLTWLRERFARVVPWLSYPYGRHTPEVARRAAQAGYRAALRTEGGGWRRPPADPYALPRLNVAAGFSRDRFVLQLAGVYRWRR